jgi:predicted RNase H-like nuclease
MRSIGVDGCRGGWIAVTIDEGHRRFRILGRIDALALQAGDSVLIDIPIGLPARGRRGCDLEARRMLGAAWPRVFLDIRRPLLAFDDYEAANRWGKTTDDNGISRQLWAILPKIAEVDRWITPQAQDAVYEAHPELAFMRLNGGAVLHPGKKTKEGRALRRGLVRAAGFCAIDAWLGCLRGQGAGPDDLLDACALALAARDPRRVAGGGATDERGLVMDIWY